MTKKVILMLVGHLLFASLVFATKNNNCFTMSGVNGCTNYVTGGPPGHDTPAFTDSDNWPNAKLYNVWHPILNGPTLAGFASGYDVNGNMLHYGWTSGGSVYEYKDYWATTNPNTWVSHPEMGTATLKLAYGSFGSYPAHPPTLWSMQNDGNCPNVAGFGQSYHIYAWLNSAWTISGFGCVFDFALSNDQSGVAIVINYYSIGNFLVTQWSNGNGVWTYGPGGGGWKHVAMGRGTQAIATNANSGNSIWQLNLGTGGQNAVSLGGASTVAPATDTTGTVWVVGTDTAVYRWNGNAWERAQGTGFTSINTCGSNCTFTTTASAPYRYPDNAITMAVSLTGNTSCNPSCPTGVTHAGTVYTEFAAHSLCRAQNNCQVASSPQVAPDTQINITASDTTMDWFGCADDNWDPSLCLTPASNGQVICSIASLIFMTVFTSPPSIYQASTTRVDFTGYEDCWNEAAGSVVQKYLCGTQAGCSFERGNFRCDSGVNPTPPPDYIFSAVTFCGCSQGSPHCNNWVNDGQHPPHPNPALWGADGNGQCWYTNGLGNSPPVACLHKYPATANLLDNGPVVAYPLYAPQVPVNAPGRCTQWGITH